GAARARPPAAPLGPARSGRRHPGARTARARDGRAPHATRRAARPHGGAGGALGAAAAVSRGVDLAPGMKILGLDDVTFWYPATANPALENVSLDVAPGDIVALVGRGGAGASPLRLIARRVGPRGAGGRPAAAVGRGGRAVVRSGGLWSVV